MVLPAQISVSIIDSNQIKLKSLKKPKFYRKCYNSMKLKISDLFPNGFKVVPTKIQNIEKPFLGDDIKEENQLQFELRYMLDLTLVFSCLISAV